MTPPPRLTRAMPLPEQQEVLFPQFLEARPTLPFITLHPLPVSGQGEVLFSVKSLEVWCCSHKGG